MYGASCADAETKRSDSDGVSATRASHLGPKLGTQPLELQAGADHLHPHVRIDVAEAAEEGREVPALLAQVNVVEIGVRCREQLGQQPDHVL